MMKIKEVHVYPNVTWTTLTKDLKYDVAILELEKEVKLTPKVESFSNTCLTPNFRCFRYVFQEALLSKTIQTVPR